MSENKTVVKIDLSRVDRAFRSGHFKKMRGAAKSLLQNFDQAPSDLAKPLLQAVNTLSYGNSKDIELIVKIQQTVAKTFPYASGEIGRRAHYALETACEDLPCTPTSLKLAEEIEAEFSFATGLKGRIEQKGIKAAEDSRVSEALKALGL